MSLFQCGIDSSDIGIISPYRQQVKLIRETLNNHLISQVLIIKEFYGSYMHCKGVRFHNFD